MKTFLILAFLAMAVTMATASVQFDPTWQFQPQQPYSQGQQQPTVQQQSFLHQYLQQQLNPCRQFLVQQCIPVPIVPFLRSQILQQSSCQVIRQQCCRQLVQIPEQLRSPAIHTVVHAIILQQQQQQFGQGQQFEQGQQSFFQPQQQQGFFQPQGFLIPQQQQQQGFYQSQQQQVAQGFIQPQQIAQFEALRTFTLQTLPAMCNVQVPPYYFTTTAQFGGF